MKTQIPTIEKIYANKNWCSDLKEEELVEKIKTIFKRFYKELELYGAAAGAAMRK
ncbi:hypothetical protein [Flavivirga spongiicola]|uniref:Uncharacterized protein n=1 Tax=Flavivirga spongiicola TaxID=421621 RepID=A0ABU7XUU3_9FLAO|nr:hypothetical protein [Flavivirga sp. MEBiC05379]MDO5979555.1 hypothetical protein [Flavivirga sp. MEBiC05379]